MTHQDARKYMNRGHVESVGGTVVARVCNGETIGYVDKTVLVEPGFYFMVKGTSPARQVAARFFVGNQRSGQGFNATLSHIRQGRSQLARTLGTNGVTYDVYFVPANKMKPLTTGYLKGQLALAFTRQHRSDMQTLSEMNHMLNDNFQFILQSY